MLSAAKGLLLIAGSPRSGTTWMAKIFDSHPQVLYRHEPDRVIGHGALPSFCSGADVTKYTSEAKKYIDRLANVRHLDTVGNLPIMRKAYRHAGTDLFRKGLIYFLKGCERLGAGLAVGVPDWIGGCGAVTVLKSVSSEGQLNLLSKAVPELRVIYIVRHPCGHINSMLRGMEKNQFNPPLRYSVRKLAATEHARRRGLTEGAFDAMDIVEKLAWRWTLANEKALEDVEKMENAQVVRYEDLCLDPLGVSRVLFEFAQIDWSSQTEGFITFSTSKQDDHRYYGIFRNPEQSAWKWRAELGASQVSAVRRIVDDSLPGRLYEDDWEEPATGARAATGGSGVTA